MPDSRTKPQFDFPRPPESLYGVVGHPVRHTLSPLLHTWSFASQEIPAAYMGWDIEASAFDAFMLAVRTLPIHGLSVTLPHKQRVIPYLDHITSQAGEIRAVNTLYWKQGELWGDNTDCQGIRRPLEERSLVPSAALILGAGGAALATVRALLEMGCSEIIVAARNYEKAAEMFPHAACIPWDRRGDWAPDLLVNTTPLGMTGDCEHFSPWPTGHSLQKVGWVFDLVYTPLQTQLLQEAQKAGCTTISGLEMFVYQALGQCELWTGQGFDPKNAKSLLVDHLQ